MVEVRFSGVSGKGSEVLRRIPTGICVEAKAGWRKITYLFYFFGLSETKTINEMILLLYDISGAVRWHYLNR